MNTEQARELVRVHKRPLVCSSTEMQVVTLDAFAPAGARIKPYDRLSRRPAALV